MNLTENISNELWKYCKPYIEVLYVLVCTTRNTWLCTMYLPPYLFLSNFAIYNKSTFNELIIKWFCHQRVTPITKLLTTRSAQFDNFSPVWLQFLNKSESPCNFYFYSHVKSQRNFGLHYNLTEKKVQDGTTFK